MNISVVAMDFPFFRLIFVQNSQQADWRFSFCRVRADRMEEGMDAKNQGYVSTISLKSLKPWKFLDMATDSELFSSIIFL